MLTVTDAYGFFVTKSCVISVNSYDSSPYLLLGAIVAVIVVVAIFIGLAIASSRSKRRTRDAPSSILLWSRPSPTTKVRQTDEQQPSPMPDRGDFTHPAYCPTCGKHHVPGDRFCMYCGTPLFS